MQRMVPILSHTANTSKSCLCSSVPCLPECGSRSSLNGSDLWLLNPSGYVAWVTEAFGPFLGFLEGLFSWISGVTDNAIYPVMFLTYLDAAWPGANLMAYKK